MSPCYTFLLLDLRKPALDKLHQQRYVHADVSCQGKFAWVLIFAALTFATRCIYVDNCRAPYPSDSLQLCAVA